MGDTCYITLLLINGWTMYDHLMGHGTIDNLSDWIPPIMGRMSHLMGDTRYIDILSGKYSDKTSDATCHSTTSPSGPFFYNFS